MNNRIYISGRITGDPSYIHKFEAAEVTIGKPWFFDRHGVIVAERIGAFGFEVVNPTTLTFLDVPLREFPWRICMVVCLWHLLRCSTVYMLYDWRNSRGACIEHKVAKKLHKHIIYQ